ncbi:glycosyltransferase family 2 protein [Calothrix sp. NIES-3974]|uniref:glycosyltransferase family 2 protein n=1 Tax=Calothrix sp. NIES-3974 TaxID=2005462 RepID=UPI000B608278|nr:glycosyltransferase family 2 protein [Calothrix sp. NIES-3974]BAZ03594.1 family 2 glycosyl transferase [Calothrix sp. NIES-3974]
MKKHSKIQLPDLNKYREDFARKGIQTPLQTVPFTELGLLTQLPTPSSSKTGWPWTVESKPLPPTMANGKPWPKISIVTPSYNQGKFIEETIRSVLLQNYPNLEFIICDGGSTDETKEILEKYSPWLSFWQSQKDRGQGHAINLGFSLCSGDYFAWINSDDFYLPNCFQDVIQKFLVTNIDFIYGDALTVYEDNRTPTYWYAQLVLDRYLYSGGIIASHSAFWKSSIHAPIWEEMNCNIDGELWQRLVAGRSKKHLKKALGACRIQSEQKTTNERYRALWDEDNLKIWSVYGYPPKVYSLKWWENNLVQRFYYFIHKKIMKSGINDLILQGLRTCDENIDL